MARKQRQSPPAPVGYLERSKRPLAALLFLLPLIVLYEFGLYVYGANQDIVARNILRYCYQSMGVTGAYLPGLIVAVVLLSMHVVRRDPWRLDVGLVLPMLAESCLLAAPLYVFMLVLTRQPQPAAASALASGGGGGAWAAISGGGAGGWAAASKGGGTWQAKLVFSVGAGIYEELLFRLIGLALLHLLLVDIGQASHRWGAGAAIVLTSAAFAMYHFGPNNPFDVGKFLFYSGAGAYLAFVYLGRGFGIVAGTHAMYDVFVVLSALWHAH